MPRLPNPIDDEDLFDVILLGGQTSPGQVKLSGHDREIDWDVKVGPGTSGATTTLKAEKPVEFTAAFYLADEDDIAAWPAFADLIRSTVSSAKAKALDVYHPDLAANDIKSVVMKKIAGAVHDGKGGQTITVTFLEYKPAKPKPVTPAGSKGGGSNGKSPDPDAAAKAELDALTKQYAATPWGPP